MKKYKSGLNTPVAGDLEFERALEDWRKVVKKIKAKAVKKYGVKAAAWFA
jgi:hypothetical protein